jgi:hypothetical protein
MTLSVCKRLGMFLLALVSSAALAQSFPFTPPPLPGNWTSQTLPLNGIICGTPATTKDMGTLYWNGTYWQVLPVGTTNCSAQSGTGTVQSVALTAPSVFAIAGSPITTSGTLALTFATGQTANEFLATPNGTTGPLGLRLIASADLPPINLASSANGGVNGNLSVSHLNSGTGASATTFWSGNGTWATPAGGGSVTSLSIATANGFSGSVANPTTTPTATLSTTIAGPLKGSSGALAAESAADVVALFGAGCNSGTVLGGAGNCVAAGNTPGSLILTASGDTSGVTDLADLQAVIGTLAGSVRTPPGFSQAAPVWNVQVGPGTFYFVGCGTNILGSSTTKTQGIWFQGSGRGVTVFYFNPPAGGCPLLVNNHGLDVKFNDMTNVGGSNCPDFLWSQEQAGISNIQDDTFQDVEWQGCWNNGERLTGGNNNSEQKFSRITAAGTMKNFLYTPPQVTTTITSGTTTLAATINNEEVESGDTGFFPTACAPFTANTQYYVRPGATTSGFTLSATSGGSAISPTANCTVAFQTGNDQFLNFWIDSMKFDTGTSQSQLINMAYGGSIHITNLDVSGYAPASAGSCLFTLGTSVNNGVHSGGVENFSVDHFRIEISSNNVCVMNDNWWRGTVAWNNRDESSQAGNRTISNIYDTYNFTQNGGPTVEYRNYQMMGKHAYVVGSNDYTYQSVVHYENVTLLDNPSFANAIAMSGTNTGGYPLIKCDNCKNNLVSSTVGYQEIVDTCLNWQYNAGKGACQPKSVSCLGAQSNWPISGGALTWRFPLNAAILQNYWWKAAGSSNTGSYSYTFQTTEATPTVLGGPYTGTASSSAIARQTAYGANGSVLATTTPFVMTTDLARTIQIVDNASRSGAFGSGIFCEIEYIG